MLRLKNGTNRGLSRLCYLSILSIVINFLIPTHSQAAPVEFTCVAEGNLSGAGHSHLQLSEKHFCI